MKVGLMRIEVFDPHNRKIKHVLPVKNQADILYYSGHGWSPTGELLSVSDSGGCVHPSEINPAVNWKEDLEYFVIAGCGVLDPDSKGISDWAIPFVKNGPLKGLVGYYGRAPLDNPPRRFPRRLPSSVDVATRFINNLINSPTYDFDTGDPILNAWLEANAYHQQPAIAYTKSSIWWVVKGLWGLCGWWWVVKKKQDY